jgi:hypothetical protein
VSLPNETKTFEGEQRFDCVDLRESGCNQLGVAARGDDGEFTAVESLFQFGEQPVNQAAIAMNGAYSHRFFGAFSDRPADFSELDQRQQGGFLVQVIGHSSQAGRDDTAYVIALTIHDIESDGGAKIDDYNGLSIVMACGGRIGEPVGSNCVRLGVIDPDTAQSFWGKNKGGKIPQVLGRFADTFSNVGHDTAKSGTLKGVFAYEAAQLLLRSAVGPG